MVADRRIDPDRSPRIADALLELRDLFVKTLAHPVQSLELERRRARECLDRGNRVRIVSSEGRIEHVTRSQHLLSRSEIGHVGRDLARKYGVVGKSGYLRRLDLRVPVGALHKPDHQLAAV